MTPHTAEIDVTEEDGWIEDHCPVCTSDDLTVPSGPFLTRCRSCGASWPAAQRVLCHVRGCVRHFEGMHVDRAGDAVVHIGCSECISGVPMNHSPAGEDR